MRKHFIEEMCDTLMYFNDLMLCYGVTPEELEMMLQELRRKRDRQMRRRTPVRREPSFRIVDPVSIQDEMRDFMQDMRDFIRNPFGKRH